MLKRSVGFSGLTKQNKARPEKLGRDKQPSLSISSALKKNIKHLWPTLYNFVYSALTNRPNKVMFIYLTNNQA
jgi:hypothetical protein